MMRRRCQCIVAIQDRERNILCGCSRRRHPRRFYLGSAIAILAGTGLWWLAIWAEFHWSGK